MEDRVEEFQGLFGPVSVSEIFIQRLWHRRRFTEGGLRLSDGRRISIVHPGSWNRLDGPDFRDAIVKVGEATVQGDVEIHFHAADWEKHGHHRDPNFNGVVLHVVLFPGDGPGGKVRTQDGQTPLELVLLPHLDADLETLAEEEALRSAEADLSGPDGLHELASRDAAEQEAFLIGESRRRWLQKVARARYLLSEQGWEETFHMLTLEVLGYSRNRSQMVALARGYPLHRFLAEALDPEDLFAYQEGLWVLSGLRPANHPRKRITEYCRWVSHQPEWPALVFSWTERAAHRLKDEQELGATQAFRKTHFCSRARTQLKSDILDGALGGTRLETWVGDAVFPLYSAQTGRDLFPFWFHWFPGDAPALVSKWAKIVLKGCPGSKVHANGWNQGILACIIREQTGLVQLSFRDLPFG